MNSYILGVDDTDSVGGMCTTYLGYLLQEMLKEHAVVKGYPRLIRLNPCISYKTRGNAAVSLQIETNNINKVKKIAASVIEENAHMNGENTNPGLVLVPSSLRDNLSDFASRAVRDVIEIKEAFEVIEEYSITHEYWKNGRGLIGALASTSLKLVDSTFELIAYRRRECWGKPRKIDESSVFSADEATFPGTWDTVDRHYKKVVFAPHSPDPILFGIRGDCLSSIEDAYSMIRHEPIEGKMVYKTNQGTDMHIIPSRVSELKPQRSYLVQGHVIVPPGYTRGGHLFFSIKDKTGVVECAAFEPTKNFRKVVEKFKIGDLLRLYGSYINTTLNLEKVEVLSVKRTDTKNPVCCKRSTKSKGKGQGFRCSRCGKMFEAKTEVEVERELKEGFYEVPPVARRHLAKPLIRGEKPLDLTSFAQPVSPPPPSSPPQE